MDPLLQLGLPILGNALSSIFNGLVHYRNGSKSRELQTELEEKRQASQLKLANIQIEAQARLQGKLEGDRQQFQKRMALLGFAQNLTLEQMRQQFQERLTVLNHQHQMEITQFSKQVDVAISQQNLDFQKWRFEQEQQLQRELADYNRQTQFALAAYQRETTFKSQEVNQLFKNWPLRIIPSHILSKHPNQQVAPLRVIIAPPVVDIDVIPDPQKGFPKIEKRLAGQLQELRKEFYPLESRERPIEILDGAWDSARYHGGSSIKVLFEMLKSEPVLILQSEVDGNYLTFRVAYWGLGQGTYSYETLLSRFPYREILYESAKARALKWKETREKLLAAGLSTPEQVDKSYGQDNPSNLKRLELEKSFKEAGLDNNIPINYQVNNEDFEVLCQLLESYHCIVTAVIADAHHLLHHNTPPLLAQWLPKYLNPTSPLPQEPLQKWVFSTYQELFKALQLEQSRTIPDLTLRLASDLARLEDKSWAKQQLVDSLRFWRQLPLLPSPEEDSLTALLKVEPSSLSEADMAYLEKIKSTLVAVQDNQGASEVQLLLSQSEKRKEEEKRKEDETCSGLVPLIAELVPVLQSLGMTEKMTVLDEVKERVQSNKFKVLVIGEFGVGKTTLVKALLGEEIWASYGPHTLINTVKWAEKPQAFIHFNKPVDGSIVPPQSIPMKDLAQYTPLKGFDEARQSRYSHIELFWPLELCRHDVEIDDLPGLGDSLDHQEMTRAYVKKSDAVLFVMSCSRLGSVSEKQSIDTIRQLGHEEIIFICNHFDVIRKKEKERVRQYALSLLRPLTKRGEEGVFFISAIDALDGRLENDPQLVEQSGVPQLEAALAILLSEDRTRIKIRRAVTTLKKVIRDARKTIAERERFLDVVTVEDGVELKALRNQLESIEKRVDALVSIGYELW